MIQTSMLNTRGHAGMHTNTTLTTTQTAWHLVFSDRGGGRIQKG